MNRIQEIDTRLAQIETEIDTDNADLGALLNEVKELKAERNALTEKAEQRKNLLASIADGNIGTIIRSFSNPAEPAAQNTRETLKDKAIFRSGEKLSEKYAADIDAEKCIRAAITGNREDLNEAEKRSVTPSSGGALLAPEISSLLIDNFRKADWMQIFQPTIIMMKAGETKIPNITALPTAVMHTPGTVENSSDPTIEAATLNARTIMVVVEVANELLYDATTSQGVIIQACTDALSNKLLQQVLYGNGIAPEMKGITTYDAPSFADAGTKAEEADIFRLVTMAKMAIVKNGGYMNAMLYDCDLEDRFNKRLPTGELIEPCRAFTELYNAGKVLPHPSVATGDMLFMQADALYMGFREGMKIEVDPYSAFNSNNTKFRLIMRGDIFANTAKMVYYSGIPAIEPAP